MQRCDFASIMEIVRGGFMEGAFSNQIELVDSLFLAYIEEGADDVFFDASQVNQWFNGLLKPSPAMCSFYTSDENNQDVLADAIEEVILPRLSDPAMVVEKVFELLVQDASVSERKKQELIALREIADSCFLAAVLTFGMSRPFIVRDIRKPQIKQNENGAKSPPAQDYIFDASAPKPCRNFCGRDAELAALHEALEKNDKVFLQGIAGIGKSEIAKAYAKSHKKEYTNIGYHPDGRRKTKSFYARTQKEVKEKGNKFLEELASRPKLNGEMLFKDWADMWYESMKGQVSDTTYEGYQFTLKLLKDYFGTMPLASIKAIQVETFLKDMLAQGKTHSYMTKFRGMMFQIMKKAEANDLIYRNPVAVADKIKAPEKLSMKDAFTADEIRLLMENLPDDRLGWSIRLLLGTGMRSQELLALEPKHIEEDGSCIHIRQAVTLVKGTPKIGPPKTKTSYRDIPVPEKLKPYAVKLRQTSEPYIWHGVKSPICNPSVFRKHYTDALRAIPGVRSLSPHCCRHTYVSQLQASGVDIETIKSLSGHADIDMTQHYLHVQKEIKERAAGQLNQVF